ncbi:unnamed protein product [Diabrotica balteata]|uniref:PLAT domain-containing protein n=1 Tax=Diabrotica balteata TaxID=107213 RepID=A0A9P0DWR5_DIABA|nr:unnamed protein product [Diabrotica balteata]
MSLHLLTMKRISILSFWISFILLLLSGFECSKQLRKLYFQYTFHQYFILESRFRKKDSKCGSKLEFIDCPDTEDNYIMLSRHRRNIIKVKYTIGKQCKVENSIFHWSLKFSNETNLLFENVHDDTFILEPYSLDHTSNPYQLLILIVEDYADDEQQGEMLASCNFEIEKEIPIPIIKGGLEVTWEVNKDIILDGSDSIDTESPANSTGNLEYKWSCTVNKETLSKFCKENLKEEPVIVIPAQYVVQGVEYYVKLEVKSVQSDWEETSQKIYVLSGASTIEIICEKNCIPKVLVTNPKEPVILTVECKKGCETVLPTQYTWTVDKDDFPYDKTRYGREGTVFFIEKEVLNVDTAYVISVELKTDLDELKGKTAVKINVHKPPSFTECSVKPEKGKALRTYFAVRCSFPKGSYFFEVYSVANQKEILLDRSVRLGNIDFLLPAGADIMVKLIDDYGFSGQKVLNPTVEDPLIIVDDVEKMAYDIDQRYFKKKDKTSLLNLLRAFKYVYLSQKLSIFADELVLLADNKNMEPLVVEQKIKILKLLNKIPLDTISTAKQIASITVKTADVTNYLKSMDPEIANRSTTLCLKAVTMTYQELSAKRYIQSFGDEIYEQAQIYTDCAEVGASRNTEIMKPPPLPGTPTTPFPLLTFPVVVENYPDYVDDQNISKHKKTFGYSELNLVKICRETTKMLAHPLSPYENDIHTERKYIDAVAIKKFGQDLPQYPIDSYNVHIVASDDFLNQETESFQIQLCTCKIDPVYPLNKLKIDTTIAVIEFWQNGGRKQIQNFKDPYIVAFTNVKINEARYDIFNDTTELFQLKALDKEETDFNKLNLYRIDAYGLQDYFIEFVDLDNTLEVYITQFYKPTFTEFKSNAKLVSPGDGALVINENIAYDHWSYLAVASHDDKEKSTKNTNNSYIECSCLQTSIMGGRLENNRVTKQFTLYMDHKLEAQACYIIFGCVLFIWILYCLFLTLFSVSPKYEKMGIKRIYLLSDIPSFYKFGYILIIKTATTFNAGTTSNIIVKLYGNLADSKEHILNYPDPEKKILQKSHEDWFFLATEYYLGEIQKIELWFDSIGYRPSWFCEEIEVIDLQQDQSWWFPICFKFQIKDKEQHIYSGAPIDPKHVTKRRLFWKELSVSLSGPHFWNIFEQEDMLSRIKRLTILLSIFLTTFMVVLFFYVVPVFQPKDSLDYYEYKLYPQVFAITALGSVISFVIHCPVVILFRFLDKHNLYITHSTGTIKNMPFYNLACWCTLGFFIGVMMTINIIFGIRVPHVTSLLWLTSSIASLFVYGLLLERMGRILRNLLKLRSTRIMNILNKKAEIVQYIETQRNMIYSKYGRLALRPYFNKVYQVLDNKWVKELKYLAEQRQNVLVILEDLLMIGIYVILLYIIIAKDKDPMTINSNKEVLDVIQGVHTRTSFTHMHNRKEIESYIQKTLIPLLQSQQWYGMYVYSDPGMTIDNTNKYIGIVRLRQKRVDPRGCKVVSQMHDFRNECIPEFSTNSEFRNFSENWQDNTESDKFARMDSVWKYISPKQTGSMHYIGDFARYSGGGYVATLGRTLTNSIININYLTRNKWIDDLTKGLFIEFLLYSANSNLFNSVKILFEISSTGYIQQKYMVRTARLLLAPHDTGVWIRILFVFFIVAVFTISLKLIYRFKSKKKKAIGDIWLLTDVVIILLTATCFVLYILRSQEVKAFLQKIELSKHNRFIKYFHLFYSEITLTSLAAFLVFLATFRVWKLLRFLVIIKIVEKTLAISAFHLFCLFILHFHLLVVFTLAAYLLFATQTYDFKDPFISFVNLFLAAFGLFKFDTSSFTSAVHYIYYIFLMVFNLVFVNLYIVLVNIYYGQAQMFYSNYQEYNVMDYVKEQWVYLKLLRNIKVKQVRQKSGQDENIEKRKLVSPKADEHRYAKGVIVQEYKMVQMKLLALCWLRNMHRNGQFSESDRLLIKRTLAALLLKLKTMEKPDFFFINYREGSNTLIDDLKFQRMESILNNIFGKGQQEKADDIKTTEIVYETVMNNNDILLNRILNNLDNVSRALDCIYIDTT